MGIIRALWDHQASYEETHYHPYPRLNPGNIAPLSPDFLCS